MDTGRTKLGPSFRFGEELPRRVVVLRALHLGDLLCAVPAFRALRAALPRAHMVLLGLPWAKTFVEHFPRYFDGFLELPGYPGLPEREPQPDRIPEFLQAVQAERFDLALQMHGCGTITNPLTAQLGARVNAGFFLPGEFCPDAERFLPYPQIVPEVWRHLRLMQFLGVPLQGEELEFTVRDEDRLRLGVTDGAGKLRPGGYICIHPGARAAARRWPPWRFAAVADALAASGLSIVLTGSAEEAPLTRAVSEQMQAPAINMAGHTNLGSLAALLDGAWLLVCNDTGVSHLAAALRVPSVVVFHHLSEREGWPPLDRQLHRIVCSIDDVSPSDVIAQAEELLGNERVQERFQAGAGKKELSCVPFAC